MNTNTDIRIAVSFKGHRKRRKLRMLLGAGSTDYLIDLWINTATNHPDGVLTGMSAVDVALEAGWEDDPEKFVGAMLDAGFLDQEEDGPYVLHDWEDHQPFVIEAPKRSQQAKKAAEARWGKKPAKPSESKPDAQSMQAECRQHADRNAPTYLPTKDNNRVSPLPPTGGQGQPDLSASPEDNPDVQPDAEISSLNDCAIEFQDLVATYQQAGGFADIVPAYKAYQAMRHNFPLSRIVDDLEQRQHCDQWQRGRIPKLSTYLRDRVWISAIPVARASPSRDPTAPRNYRECQDLERRQEAARLKAAEGGQNAGFRNGESGTGAIQPRALPAKSVDA